MFKKILSIITFLFLILNAKLIFNQKEPFEYPDFSDPDENEKNGLHLKIKLNSFITEPARFSISYRRPELNRLNKSIDAQINDILDYKNHWIIQLINTQEDYIINRESKWRYNSIVFDKTNKPLYIERDTNERFKSDLILPEISKFYIPDRIIKINDQWELEFKDIKPDVVNRDNDKKFYEIFMSGKFKLLGYVNHKNIRCAVIESVITVNAFDMYVKSSSQLRKTGSGIMINSQIHNLVYVDYKNDKVVFSKTYLKQIAQGTYLKNYGSTPEDVKKNILEDYKDLINGDETYIMQIFFNYLYT